MFEIGDLVIVDFDGSAVTGRICEYSHESRLYAVRLYNGHHIMGIRHYYEDEMRNGW